MLGIVIDIFVGGSSEQRANAWFNNANLSMVVAGVNIFFIVSNVVSLSAVAQLLHFHIGLQRKNLTTYQFIVTDNARRRESFQKKEQRRTKRVAAVSKARQEGKQLLARRLELGPYCCAACDPLPQDEEAPSDAGVNGTATKDETTSGYAELSDGDVGAASTDEKTSMTSERDLARTNAISLGESSSSQLEAKQDDDVVAAPSMSSETDMADTNAASRGESSSSQLETKQEEEIVTAEGSAENVVVSNEQASNGAEAGAAAETAENSTTENAVMDDSNKSDVQENSNNVHKANEDVESKDARQPKPPAEPNEVEPEKKQFLSENI